LKQNKQNTARKASQSRDLRHLRAIVRPVDPPWLEALERIEPLVAESKWKHPQMAIPPPYQPCLWSWNILCVA
jgi:hypothetical protein